jgi:hypothetical protein
MELFLNLCWLSLLLPAYLLWRQRTLAASKERHHGQVSPLIFVCVLGCALVLLFPVISASDDLHAMRPEMEESERAFRHAGHCACMTHIVPHDAQLAAPGNATIAPNLEPVGLITSVTQHSPENFSAQTSPGRAPPVRQCVLFL